MSEHRLRGRAAVVTGAASGIGFAIASRLVAEGARLVLNDLTRDGCQKAVARLGVSDDRVAIAPGDISDPDTAARIVDAARSAFGGLDIVVNNAGLTRDAGIHRMTDTQWSEVHQVTLFGAFALLRATADLMRQPTEGDYHRKVINISSSVGVYGAPGIVNYAAAKAGLIGLTRGLAREWARYRVNVNAVAPGLIEGTKLTQDKPPDLIAGVAAKAPLGRAGRPEDVAAAVSFLASPDSDYITGQVLEIHGGMEVLS